MRTDLAPDPANTVSPLEGCLVFLGPTLLCLVVGARALEAGQGDWGALSALSHAVDAAHKEPRFNLALIGFGAPPLPALLYLLPASFAPKLASQGLACPLLGALLLGASAVALNGLCAWAGLTALLRWPLTAVFVLHPLMLSMAVLGSPNMPLVLWVVAAAGALARWARDQSFRHLLTASLFLTAAVLTQYQALWPALAATLFVAWTAYHEGGYTRAEGTLLAFALPLVYAGAVWIAANWAIMGDPFHFRVAATGNLETLLPWPERLKVLSWTTVLTCPPLLGLILHELGRVTKEGAAVGAPVAWMSIGALLGALLTAPLAGQPQVPWGHLFPLALTVTGCGYVLLGLVGGRYLQGFEPASALRVVAGLLAVLGLGAAISLRSMGFDFPGATQTVLGGEVVGAADVSAERDAGHLIARALPRGSTAFVVGGQGYAVALFSGNPKQVFVVSESVLSGLPLRPGDLLALHQSADLSFLFPLLVAKGLDLAPVQPSSPGSVRWQPWQVRAVVRYVSPQARSRTPRNPQRPRNVRRHDPARAEAILTRRV